MAGGDAEADGERGGALEVASLPVAHALHHHHQDERDQRFYQQSLYNTILKIKI